MKFDINTLKRATCAVIAAFVLLLGTWTEGQAQRRNRGADNGYPNEKGREWAARTFRRLLEETSLAMGATGKARQKIRAEAIEPEVSSMDGATNDS